MRTVSLLSLLASCAVLVAAAPANEAELSSARGPSCRNPEVRKEWRNFSKREKAAYISAVKCLAKRPHSKSLKASYPRADLPAIKQDSSFYDDMTYIHMDLTNQIHYTGFFLPWHRWYTNQHVTQLKKQCGYKGVMPYWDWSKDTASFNTSAMWDGDSTSGLGGFGDPNNDYYLTNGGFKDMQVSYPIKHTIRRQYNPFPYLTWWWVPRPEEAAVVGMQQSFVDAAINGYEGDFMGFQNATEKAQAFHANVHMIMGGDLAGTCPTAAGSTCQGGSTWTPNDPMFFLHHANIDRIWWLWQRKSPRNFFAFKGGSNMTYTDPAFPNGYPPWLSITDKMPTDNLFSQPTILSTMNTLSGDYCYVYQ
ncbi:Di-copper centre-containing protein [Rhizoctonia solani]|nr:Di-copper centre-containing protein [Rhizoctonia solani]